ncbi:MAG: hypothetical protein JST55_14615 [Bacteroidetes bacterium]|nr:hypothetical protein [Bacteroidota bacterium]
MNTCIEIDNSLDNYSYIKGTSGATKLFKDKVIGFFKEPSVKFVYPERNINEEGILIARLQIEVFKKLFDVIIEYTPEQAKKKYKEVHKILEGLIDFNKDIVKIFKKEKLHDLEFSMYFDEAIVVIEEFIKSLKTISESKAFEEDTNDCDEFISEIVFNTKFSIDKGKTGDSFEELIKHS